MSIFDIDEMINDPWAGMRNTELYRKYVSNEVLRLFNNGELEDVSLETFLKYERENNPNTPTWFIFDESKFNYLYIKTDLGRHKVMGGCRIDLYCEEWDADMSIVIKDGEIVRYCDQIYLFRDLLEYFYKDLFK